MKICVPWHTINSTEPHPRIKAVGPWCTIARGTVCAWIVVALADEVIVIPVRQFVKDDKWVAIRVPQVSLDAERHERLRILWNRVPSGDQPRPSRVIRQVHLLLVLVFSCMLVTAKAGAASLIW